MKTLIAGLVLILSLGSACADPTQWYILGGGSRQCRLANALEAPAARSPYAMEMWMRGTNQYKEPVVTRSPDGSIQSAFVANNRDNGILFLNGLATCTTALRLGLENGNITSPSELR